MLFSSVHQAPLLLHCCVTGLCYCCHLLRDHQSQKQRCSVVEVERKGERLTVLVCTILEASQSSIEFDEQSFQSLFRCLIVQPTFIFFLQTTRRGVYFPNINIGCGLTLALVNGMLADVEQWKLGMCLSVGLASLGFATTRRRTYLAG